MVFWWRRSSALLNVNKINFSYLKYRIVQSYNFNYFARDLFYKIIFQQIYKEYKPIRMAFYIFVPINFIEILLIN